MITMERLGLFGGTFDPPHNGHIFVAQSALDQAQLDWVLFVVAGQPWQKVGKQEVSPAEDRCHMTSLLIQSYARMSLSRAEVDRSGPSFTIDTLEEMSGEDREVFLIVGADAAAGIPSWHRASEVVSASHLLIAPRPDCAEDFRELGTLGAQYTMLDMAPVDLSSREIRRRCAGGESIDHLVPAPIGDYIKERGLYGSP